QSDSFPEEAAGFANTPLQKIRFPTLIIASADDPFDTLDHVHARANLLGSGLVAIGPFGNMMMSFMCFPLIIRAGENDAFSFA
ncbi:alpha/beta hydrolase, partial [Rhizobium ruizarguesonis]